MASQARKITTGSQLQNSIASGVKKVYKVAKSAYGPKAGNVLIENPYGDPSLSRDGVKNIKRLYAEDPIENMAMQVIKQASDKTNKTAGDGTTAVAILSYYLYKECIKLLASGYNRMELSEMLKKEAVNVIEQVNSLSKAVDDKLLDKVCQISSGDDNIGLLVSSIIKSVGADGGVTIESFAGNGIFSDIVSGFYFKKGFTTVALISDQSNLVSKHKDCMILMCEKPMNTVADIAPILDKIAGTKKINEVVLIGDCGPEVLEMMLLNRLKGIINVTPVSVPYHDAMLSLFLDDLKTFVGGEVIKPGFDPYDFDPNAMLGAAEQITIDEHSTTIIGGDGSKEDLDFRLAELKNQLRNSESEVETNVLRDRIGRLEGKVALIKVGGVTNIEQAEVELRVEDAICAGQSAYKKGIVPGGGVTLARIKTLYKEFQEVFKQPFKVLCSNAGLNSERLLGLIENSSDWKGFNLKTMTERPVDLLKVGVIDPTLVIEEVVKNSTSVVSSLITTTASITYEDRDMKQD